MAALVVWRLVPDASDDDRVHIALVGPFDVGRVPYWVALGANTTGRLSDRPAMIRLWVPS